MHEPFSRNLLRNRKETRTYVDCPLSSRQGAVQSPSFFLFTKERDYRKNGYVFELGF